MHTRDLQYNSHLSPTVELLTAVTFVFNQRGHIGSKRIGFYCYIHSFLIVPTEVAYTWSALCSPCGPSLSLKFSVNPLSFSFVTYKRGGTLACLTKCVMRFFLFFLFFYKMHMSHVFVAKYFSCCETHLSCLVCVFSKPCYCH